MFPNYLSGMRYFEMLRESTVDRNITILCLLEGTVMQIFSLVNTLRTTGKSLPKQSEIIEA